MIKGFKISSFWAYGEDSVELWTLKIDEKNLIKAFINIINDKHSLYNYIWTSGFTDSDSIRATKIDCKNIIENDNSMKELINLMYTCINDT